MLCLLFWARDWIQELTHTKQSLSHWAAFLRLWIYLQQMHITKSFVPCSHWFQKTHKAKYYHDLWVLCFPLLLPVLAHLWKVASSAHTRLYITIPEIVCGSTHRKACGSVRISGAHPRVAVALRLRARDAAVACLFCFTAICLWMHPTHCDNDVLVNQGVCLYHSTVDVPIRLDRVPMGNWHGGWKKSLLAFLQNNELNLLPHACQANTLPLS